MVKESGGKMKEYGMTMICVGPQADDETKLHGVLPVSYTHLTLPTTRGV